MPHESKNPERQELIALINSLLDERASVEDRVRLESLLASSADARREYLRYTNLHVTLVIRQGEAVRPILDPKVLLYSLDSPSEVIDTTLMPRHWSPKTRATSSVLVWAGGIAAMLLLIAGLWIQFSRPIAAPTIIREPEFRIVRMIGIAETKLWTIGATLPLGVIRLERGVVEIASTEGVTIIAEGPVSFELQGPLQARLESGHIVVRMPKGERGFVVNTANSEVVDLGTEFGVSVSATGAAVVQVFDGEVDASVRRDGRLGDRRRVAAGEAFSLDPNSSDSPRKVAFDHNRFVRTLPADTSEEFSWIDPYNDTLIPSMSVVRAAQPPIIDGNLSDWNLTGQITSRLRAPYDESYFVKGALMYDEQAIYIAAHIGDPHPMRNVVGPGVGEEMAWRGGAVQVRLSTDRRFTWPLDGRSSLDAVDTGEVPYWGARLQDTSLGYAHLTMWHHRSTGQACLRIEHGIGLQGPTSLTEGYQGAIVRSLDGDGYVAEYAIPWNLLCNGETPPQPGDRLGVAWHVHWSDASGRIWRGQLMDLVRRRFKDSNLHLRPDTWGEAIYD